MYFENTGTMNQQSRASRLSRYGFPLLLAVAVGICGFKPLDEFLKSRAEQTQIEIRALPVPDTVAPGGTFEVFVVATPRQGWHFYSMETESKEDASLATRIRFTQSPFLAVGDWQESQPMLIKDEALGRMVRVHAGRTEFTRTVSVPKSLQDAVYLVEGLLTYRVCDNRVCALPQDRHFQFHVIVQSED